MKQLMQMVTMVPGQGGRLQSECFPEQVLLGLCQLCATGWSAQAGRLGPSFPVPWMESCSPQFPTWEPNSQRAGLRKGGWVLGVSSPSGLVLL